MKRGQKTNKKIDVSKAEDVNFEETAKKTEPSILTDPTTIEGEFAFEKPPTADAIPLNTPLAGETSSEGQTMKNLGFDVSSLGNFDDVKTNMGGGGEIPPTNNNGKSINLEEAVGGSSSDSGYDSVIDDVPPPNPNDKDLFDEVIDGGGSDGGGMAIPPDFVAWSATKQAEWIVQTEKILIDGFMQNRARISTIDVNQRLLKNKIPNEVSKEIIHHVKSYNNDVDANLELTKDAQKVLRMSWEAVLKQHSNISEKITPEAALVINHALIVGQLWFQGNEIKKYGKDLMMDIDASLQAYANRTSNQESQPKEKGKAN